MGSYTYPNDPAKVRVTIRYKSPVDAEVYDEHFVHVIKPGLTEIPDTFLQIVSDSEITVNPFVAMMLNENVSVVESTTGSTVSKDIQTKLDIRETYNLTGISSAAPFIVLEFLYIQSKTVTPTIKNIAYSAYDSSKQIIIGKCLYTDGGTLHSIDVYNAAQKAVLLQSEEHLESFTCYPLSQGTILAKGGMLEGNLISDKIIGLGPQTGTDVDLTLPSAGTHRYDLLYVDDDTEAILVATGEEQSETGDKYPAPDKPNQDNYTFAFSFIYLTPDSGSASRPAAKVDLENITPRFTRRTIATEFFSDDIVISDAGDMIAYFGTSALSDQGGNTPGLNSDGFSVNSQASIDRSGVKTVTVNGRNVLVRNQLTPAPDYTPTAYELYNRIILEGDSKIHCHKNVKFKLMTSYAGFYVKDDTKYQVDKYSTNLIQILSEHTIYSDITQDNYGTQSEVAVGDTVAISARDAVGAAASQKLTVSALNKSTSDNAVNLAYQAVYDRVGEKLNSTDIHAAQYTDSGIEKVAVVTIQNGGTYDNIYLYLFKYNETNKDLELIAGPQQVNSGTVNNSSPRVAVSDSIFAIVSVYGTELRVFTASVSDDPFSSAVVGDQVEDSGSTTKPTIWINSSTSDLHIAGEQSSTVGYWYATWGGSSYGTFNDSTASATDPGPTAKLGLTLVGSTRYITYKSNADSKCYCAYSTDGSSWTVKLVDNTVGGTESALISVDHPTASGGTDVWIAMTYGSSKQSIRVGILDTSISAPIITSAQTVSTVDTDYTGFEQLSFIANNNNLMNSYELMHVQALLDKSSLVSSFNINEAKNLEIELDSNGYPVMVFQYLSNVWTSVWDGSSWNSSILQGVSAYLYYIKMVRDSDGDIHLAFCNSINAAIASHLYYAKFSSGSWGSVELVESMGTTEVHGMDLDVSATGTPYILVGETLTGVRVWTKSGDDWGAGTVVAATFNARTAIAVKDDGYIYAAVSEFTGGGSPNTLTVYFGYSPTNLSSVSAATDAADNSGFAMVLDSNDRPVICYQQNTTADIVEVRMKTDFTFTSAVTIDSSLTSEWSAMGGSATTMFPYPDLERVPGTSQLIVTYYDEDATDMKLAWYKDSQWAVETLSSIGGIFPRVAVGDNGDVVVGWYDETYTNVKTMYLTRDMHNITAVNSASTSWSDKSLVVDVHALSLGMCLNNDSFAICNSRQYGGSLLGLKYTHDITVSEDIATGMVEGNLANEPAEDIEVQAEINGNRSSVGVVRTPYVISNAFNSKFDVSIENAISDAGVSGARTDEESGTLGENLTAGDLVYKSYRDGKYYEYKGVSRAELNVGVAESTDTYLHNGLVKLTDDKFLVAFADNGNSDSLGVRIGTYAEDGGDDLSLGTTVYANAAATWGINCMALSPSKTLLVYVEGTTLKAIVGRVVDNTVTFGTAVTVASSLSTTASVKALEVSEDKVLIIYKTSTTDRAAIIVTISGSTVDTTPSEVSDTSLSTAVSRLDAALLDTGEVLVIADLASATNVVAMVIRIVDTVPVWGAPVTVSSSAGGDGVGIQALTGGKALIAYSDTTHAIAVAKVQGLHSILLGTAVSAATATGANDTAMLLLGTNSVLVVRDRGSSPQAVTAEVATISDMTVTVNTYADIEASSQADGKHLVWLDHRTAVLAYVARNVSFNYDVRLLDLSFDGVLEVSGSADGVKQITQLGRVATDSSLTQGSTYYVDPVNKNFGTTNYGWAGGVALDTTAMLLTGSKLYQVPRGFGNDIKAIVNKGNDTVDGLAKIDNSNIEGSDIRSNANGKAFDDCRNIAFKGRVDGDQKLLSVETLDQ